MAETYELLTGEVQRVVDSPYPTQLKRLRDIVRKRCTEADITRWALVKPCQIDRLADCLLHGLRQWPYVLELMTRMAGSIKMRDALLYAEPSLLHDIIVQSARSHNAQSCYSAAAVALLSHPLPVTVAMPSEAQDLFVQLVQHAAREPSVTTIKPVYKILKGTATLLIGVISPKALAQFEEQLFVIVRGIKGDDQSLSLYCMAIMKIMSHASEESTVFSASSYDTQELLQSTPRSSAAWSPTRMQQFFAESKSQKTMQLIVLRAMWACTPTTGDLLDDRMESLMLANEIIVAVPTHLRETYRKGNNSSMAVRKLEEKVLSEQLQQEMRAESLFFVARLTEGGVLPATIADALRRFITRAQSHRLSQTSTIDMELMARTGILDQKTTTSMLQNVVHFLVSSHVEPMEEKADNISKILYQLSSMMHNESIADGAMLALDVLSCGDKLRTIARLAKPSASSLDNDTPQESCAQAMQSIRAQLIHQLANVYLKGALSSPHPTYAPSGDTVSLLLEIHAAFAGTTAPCSHRLRAPMNERQSLVLQKEICDKRQTEPDWRGALRNNIDSRAHSEQEALVGVFTRACSDLEARCEGVEEPLREEKKRTAAIQDQYDELAQAYAQLETEGINREIRCNAFEAERDRRAQEVESLEEEAELSKTRYDELQRRLYEAFADSTRKNDATQRKFEAAELSHATAFAKKEEDLEDLQEKCVALERNLQGDSRQLDELRKELRESKADAECMRRELGQLSNVNGEQKAAIDRLGAEKQDVLQTNEAFRGRLNDGHAQLKAEQEAHQIERLSAIQQRDADLAAVESRHEQTIAAKSTEHNEALADAERQLHELQNELDHAQERHASETERRNSQLKERQKHIDRLSRSLTTKDAQIADATAMRTNLMAAMGITHLPAPLVHQSSRSSANAQHHQGAPAPPTQTGNDDTTPPTPIRSDGDGSQDATALAAAAESFVSTSSTHSGPTPKRPRPRPHTASRRSLKVSSPSKSRLSLDGTATKASRASMPNRNAAKRPPLQGLSGNAGTRGEEWKTPSKSKAGAYGKLTVDEEDEETFDDGSELFDGNPGGY